MTVFDKPRKLFLRIQLWMPFLMFQKGSWSYAKRWLGSVIRRGSAFDDAIPWLHFGAIDWLETYLQPSMRVFEWGSGGSTLFWASRVQSVVSVEHNAEWFSRVSAAINELGHSGVELFHKPAQDESLGLKSDSHDPYVDYVAQIEAYPDGYFDLIVIDGVARLECLRRATAKIRDGGVIVFDNSDRFPQELKRFKSGQWELLGFCGPSPYEPTGSFTETSLIIKHYSEPAGEVAS